MKKDNVNYVLVGVFVIVMLLVLFAMLYKITDQEVGSVKYFTTFDDITSLKNGAQVTAGGYKIGKLAHVQPVRTNGKTRYRLELDIKGDWPIPEDSLVSIGSSGVIKDKELVITEGMSQKLLAPGSEIQSKISEDVLAMVTAMGKDLQQLVPEASQDIKQVLTKMNATMDKLARVLNEQNIHHISRTLDNADTTTSKLVILADKLDQLEVKVNHTLKQADSLLSDNQQDVRTSMQQLRHSMEAVSSHIDGIMYNLDASSRNMNEFTRQLRNNPAVLISSKPPQDQAELK